MKFSVILSKLHKTHIFLKLKITIICFFRASSKGIHSTFMNKSTFRSGNYAPYFHTSQHLTALRDSMNFCCNIDVFVSEKRYGNLINKHRDSLSILWHEHLKSIGGIDHLKPAGIFKPSEETKRLIRIGVPDIYRSTVWQQTSLSHITKCKYGENYYFDLLHQLSIMKEQEKKNTKSLNHAQESSHGEYRPSKDHRVSRRKVCYC